MALTITRQFVPLVDESAIASLEAKIGFPLPREYREFLLKFNGGEPDRAVFRFGDPWEPYSDSSVRYFFSVADTTTFSLASKYRSYTINRRVPKGMLPIATDFGDNLVLLALEGARAGQVFFWDHEIEGLVEDPDSPARLAFVAASFTEFCDKLEPSVP